MQAYFEFATDVNDDTKQVVKDAVELAKVGLRIDVNELSEKTGYSLERVEPRPETSPGCKQINTN